MANWIKGQGFYYVQPSGPYDKEKCDREMEQLRIKLDNAQKRMEERGMIGQVIKPSLETRRQMLIDDLHRKGVHEGAQGEQLQKMDYYSLRSLLARRKAVES